MHPVIFWMQDGRHVFYDITGGAAGHAPPPTNVLIQVSYVAIGGAAAHAIPHNEGLFMDVYAFHGGVALFAIPQHGRDRQRTVPLLLLLRVRGGRRFWRWLYFFDFVIN